MRAVQPSNGSTKNAASRPVGSWSGVYQPARWQRFMVSTHRPSNTIRVGDLKRGGLDPAGGFGDIAAPKQDLDA